MPKDLTIAPSLRDQIATIISQEIEAQRFANRKLPSVRALAERFDVSLITVVGALDILQQRGLIERVQGKGVFVRDRKGQSGKLGARVRQFGIFCNSTPVELAADPYYGEVWAGMIEAAGRADIGLNVLSLREGQIAQQVRRALAETNLDGAVLLAQDDRDALLQLQRLPVPFVLADHHYPGLRMDCITLDSRQGARDAVQWLRARGHASIGLLASQRVDRNRERLAGFLQGLAEAGLDAQQPFVYPTENSREGGRRGMLELLNSGKPRPDAFVVWSGPMGLGALEALRENASPAARRVDLIAMASRTLRRLEPNLSAAVADGFALGRQAVEMLERRLGHPETPYEVRLVPMPLEQGAEPQGT